MCPRFIEQPYPTGKIFNASKLIEESPFYSHSDPANSSIA